MDNELETITPEKARDLLNKQSVEARDIDSDLVTVYVENIRNGKWLLDE